MRRPIQGAIGRFLESIPVERPRDLAKPGKGTVISIKEGILKVTNFLFIAFGCPKLFNIFREKILNS